jgi:hypothetical protein
MLPTFLVQILRTSAPSETGRRMHIVVRHPYAYLEDELRQGFAGEADVDVTVDRRRGERRTRVEAISNEQRRADRRKPVERILDVILG